MQVIYNYVHETNYVSAVYNAIAILWLLFTAHWILFSMIHFIIIIIINDGGGSSSSSSSSNSSSSNSNSSKSTSSCCGSSGFKDMSVIEVIRPRTIIGWK